MKRGRSRKRRRRRNRGAQIDARKIVLHEPDEEDSLSVLFLPGP